MLVHLCYATARLLFELVFSGSCFQLSHYHCHSCVQNVPCYCDTAPHSKASHLSEFWACHPALQECKHCNSPSSWLSGQRDSARSQHISALSFCELEISSGYRDQKVLIRQQGISLSLLFVCASLSYHWGESQHKRCSKQHEQKPFSGSPVFLHHPFLSPNFPNSPLSSPSTLSFWLNLLPS